RPPISRKTFSNMRPNGRICIQLRIGETGGPETPRKRETQGTATSIEAVPNVMWGLSNGAGYRNRSRGSAGSGSAGNHSQGPFYFGPGRHRKTGIQKKQATHETVALDSSLRLRLDRGRGYLTVARFAELRIHRRCPN